MLTFTVITLHFHITVTFYLLQHLEEELKDLKPDENGIKLNPSESTDEEKSEKEPVDMETDWKVSRSFTYHFIYSQLLYIKGHWRQEERSLSFSPVTSRQNFKKRKNLFPESRSIKKRNVIVTITV